MVFVFSVRLSPPRTTDATAHPIPPFDQMDNGEFEEYAAAKQDAEFDVGDVERDRFAFDHVPESMMLPKEFQDPAAAAEVAKPKRRTSARKKAGTKL